MKQKFDTITLETPCYSMETSRQDNIDAIYLSPKVIYFKKSKLYLLFKTFMDNSTIKSVRDGAPCSLTQYIATFNDNNQSVKIKSRFGKDNIIGKFFLETNLDWPPYYYETNNHFSPEFKQPTMSYGPEDLRKEYSKGVPTILLARQGAAVVPEKIITLLNNFDPNDEIKKVAPLIVQSFRTPASPLNFFKREEIVCCVAPHLAPTSPPVDAIIKMKNEINLSQAFQDKLLQRPFSFKANEIAFNKHHGTHVNIHSTPKFIKWLSQFEQGKPVNFANGYVLFKKSENVISFNKGIGMPGIVITNHGESCFVCNNITADNVSNVENATAERQGNLKSALAHLYNVALDSMLQAEKPAPLSTNLCPH